MKKQRINLPATYLPAALSLVLPLALVLVLAGCTSSGVPAANSPVDSSAELFFSPALLPNLRIPAEAGGRTENPEDETGILKTAFCDAYMEALLRGVELTGVLGSDRCSPWPDTAPESWSQNWAIAESSPSIAPNSWGMPNLVLALGNYPALAELPGISNAEKALGVVFTVYGPILDMYGKSGGYGRANGAAGYGVPLGELFFFEGAAVQRFSRGRMIIAKEGNRFAFQDDLLNYLLENLDSEERNKEFGGRNISQEETLAFAYAWAFSFSEKEGTSDGPIARVAFSKPWILEAGSEKIAVNGFYYKSYNKAQDVLVLLISENLPLRVHRLSGPILKTIISGKRLSGLGLQRKIGASAGSGLGKSLADGFAVYGPPLSDPLPFPNQNAKTGEALFLEAQRFARGWIVVKSPAP